MDEEFEFITIEREELDKTGYELLLMEETTIDILRRLLPEGWGIVKRDGNYWLKVPPVKKESMRG